MDLTLTTWNVNSVRLRIGGIRRLVTEIAPDVICLQETKVRDQAFPHEAFADLGYRDRVVDGPSPYNGVAIVARVPLENTGSRDWCEQADGRHVFATLPGGIELHNFYVPAGGDVPDPILNHKFAHKLRFMDELALWFTARKAPLNKLILIGDLNVAPLEADVWSHRRLLNVVSHTPVEVAAMERIRTSHDWVDAVRHFIPAEEKLYSWWSYRAKDWEKSDRGRRLDHVWVTPALVPALMDAKVLKDARGWETPSDHVPVTVTLAA